MPLEPRSLLCGPRCAALPCHSVSSQYAAPCAHALQESNKSRTLFYTSLEVCVLVAMAGLQVFFVRKMFAGAKYRLSV